MSKGRLFLIDGSALAYRSYFAFARNPLITGRGEQTSVVFGFAATILRILTKEQPTHLAVVFDTQEPSFRKDMFEEYKATRVSMPAEMAEQLPRLEELLEVMKVPALRKPGFEADDLIATIATRAANDQWEVVIVSGDKDLFQLVDDRIKILNLRKVSEAGEWVDRDGVKNKMGVSPDLIVDLLALTGDTSDNVPGVPGVGPKTAVELLQQFGSYEAIFQNLDRVSRKKLQENLRNHRDLADLSRQLVTLHKEVDFDYSLDALAVPSLDSHDLRRLFLDLEFGSLLKTIGHTKEEKTMVQEYQTIDTEKGLQNVVGRIREATLFAFDTETDGLDPLSCNLVGISLAVAAGEAFYIPLAHKTGRNLDKNVCHQLLNPVLADPGIEKIAQNFKFDYQVITRAGYQMSNFDHDPMLASYVLDPSSRQHGLDALVLKHFDYRMQPITDLIGTGKKQITFDEVPIDKATFYSAEDADFTFRLNEKLEPMVREIGAEKLLHEIELPLERVLALVEMSGVKIDVEFLKKMSVEMASGMKRYEHDIFTLAGGEFNLNSPSQLAEVLFERLKLKPLRKTTKKTAYSTDVSVLTELAKQHDLPRLMLEYRHLQKLKSTYVDALPTLVNPTTGRVHTSYNQAVAATGRLSSTDPNLQNIPVRTEIGSQIRKAFIPRDESYKIAAADYSQIELRVLAHFSEDETLIQSFRNGEDVHARTASEVFAVDLKDVTPELRRIAKVTNFSVIYGVSAFGLSQQTEMSVAEAKQFIELYYARYRKIREFIEAVLTQARERGFVTTLFGRRRYLPEISAKNNAVRQFAERTAVNTIIQGTAADMIKIAMIHIQKRIETMSSKMIMQVHDELVFDARQSELDELMRIVKEEMEGCVELKVPVTVEIGVGDNWLECK